MILLFLVTTACTVIIVFNLEVVFLSLLHLGNLLICSATLSNSPPCILQDERKKDLPINLKLKFLIFQKVYYKLHRIIFFFSFLHFVCFERTVLQVFLHRLMYNYLIKVCSITTPYEQLIFYYHWW